MPLRQRPARWSFALGRTLNRRLKIHNSHQWVRRKAIPRVDIRLPRLLRAAIKLSKEGISPRRADTNLNKEDISPHRVDTNLLKAVINHHKVATKLPKGDISLNREDTNLRKVAISLHRAVIKLPKPNNLQRKKDAWVCW